jgi:hypothetical protein
MPERERARERGRKSERERARESEKEKAREGGVREGERQRLCSHLKLVEQFNT